MTHTVTPWKRDKWGNVIGVDGKDIRFRQLTCLCSGSEKSMDEAEANTDFIVRACNAHDVVCDALSHALHELYKQGVDHPELKKQCEDALKLAGRL